LDGGLEFSGSLTMAGWLRHRDLAVLSAACCRLCHAAVLHCSTCANPPAFSVRVGKAQEPVSVAAFRAQAAVKRFDVRIVGRFACVSGQDNALEQRRR
jgi:hypothetical protein